MADVGKSSQRDKKEAALTVFKEKIAEVRKPYHDDYELHKWLKARQYDVDKAAEMYRTSMAYRDKMKVDSLLTDYEPPEGYDYYRGWPSNISLEGKMHAIFETA